MTQYYSRMHQRVSAFRNIHALNDVIGRHTVRQRQRHTNNANPVVEAYAHVKQSVVIHSHEIVEKIANCRVYQFLLIRCIGITAGAWVHVKDWCCKRHQDKSVYYRNYSILQVEHLALC